MRNIFWLTLLFRWRGVSKIYYLYKNCKVENLTLTEYTTVYSDSIKKKIDKLILTSQSLVTSLNNDTNVLNKNVTNSTNSINSTSTKTTINNMVGKNSEKYGENRETYGKNSKKYGKNSEKYGW